MVLKALLIFKHASKALSSSKFVRCLSSTSALSGERLIATEYGDPSKVVKKEAYKVEKVPDDQAIVQILAAPVNPLDINMIQGVYALRPSLPFVPGAEGVGVVTRVGKGSNPHSLTEGQWVIQKRYDFPNGGTWQSSIFGDNEDFLPIPKMSVLAAATININPPTAYRMLKDFEKLEPGDTVVQNGGNSAVGQAVIQLCKEFGYKSISIVRNRDNIVELKGALQKLGDSNTTIYTEEEYRENSKKGELPTAKLALNCVGGKSSIDIARILEPTCTMVTYGGMSRQPTIISTAQLIFNDIKCVGFAIARWYELNPIEA